MATTSKSMYRGAAATSSTTLYTVPSATTAVVTDVLVTNTSGSAATFTINLNGTAAFSTTNIDGYSTTSVGMKQVLSATQTVTGFASTTSINFHISGVEIV